MARSNLAGECPLLPDAYRASINLTMRTPMRQIRDSDASRGTGRRMNGRRRARWRVAAKLRLRESRINGATDVCGRTRIAGAQDQSTESR